MASMRGQYPDLVEVDVPIRSRDRTQPLQPTFASSKW
jgi:hypothetical protein